MERQAKDGTFYRQVGQDEWEPITREAKDGTVYKKVGADDWEPLQPPKQEEGGFLDSVAKVAETVDSYTGAPSRAAVAAAQDGKNPLSAFADQWGEDPKKAPTMKSVVMKAGISDQAKLSPTLEERKNHTLGQHIISAGFDPLGMVPGVNMLPENAKDWIRENSFVGKISQADALGAAGDVAVDYTNLIPVNALAKGVTKYGGKALGSTGKFLASGAKKGLSALGGVEEAVIERYLANPERIRNAQSFDELYDEVTGAVKNVFDDLDSKKLDYEKASKHLDEVKQNIKESRVESKAAALEEVSQARAQLDEAFKAKKASIADKASPGRIDPLVDDAMQNLRKKVSKGSGEAFETLAEHGELFDVNKALKEVKKVRDSLNIAGVGPATPQARAAQAEIDGLLNAFGQLPAQLLGPDVKRLIQQVDRAGKVIYDSGAFTDEVSDAFKTLRQSMDEQLKTVKPYAEKMAQVSDDTRVLSESMKQFGKDGSRIARLQNIARPSAKYDLETLQRLAQKEGGQLPQMINETVEAQRTLRSPMRLEEIRRGLGQNEAVRAAEMKAAAAKKLAKPNAVRQAIETSAAFNRSRSAEARMKSAKDLANKFRSFGEQGAEAKLQAVARGKKNATKTLEALSQLSDKDFVEAVKAAGDAAAFDKTAFHGSRNVNLWTVLAVAGESAISKKGVGGGGAGFILGGPIGAVVGSTMGAMVDVFGPAMTKRVLDGVIKIKGPITKASIAALDVPPEVKVKLIEQFDEAMMAGQSAAATGRASTVQSLPKVAEQNELDKDSSSSSQEPKATPTPTPKKGPEKWMNDGEAKLKESGVDVSDLRSSKKGQQLLIEASTLKPGSKAMAGLIARIEKHSGGRN